jgi:hypothetical protein
MYQSTFIFPSPPKYTPFVRLLNAAMVLFVHVEQKLDVIFLYIYNSSLECSAALS